MQIVTDNQGMYIEDSEKTYHLKCEVKRKVSVLRNNETSYTKKIIYLVPQMSGEMIRFYDAYLPDYVVEVDNNELVFLNLKSGKPFRGFLSPATKDIPERHIFIMSDSESEFLDSIFKFDFTEKFYIEIECVPHSDQINYNV
jgi:hypothetical protein